MPLDITDATGDVVERIALDLPEGASTVGVQGVLITVTVSAQQGSQTIVRRPIVRGLSTDLTAQVSPETVEMTLVGPLPRLEALAEQEVFVYVELVDKGVGQHNVELTYLVPEGLEVSSLLPPSVDVVISRVPPTPTSTPTRTPTPTATPYSERVGHAHDHAGNHADGDACSDGDAGVDRDAGADRACADGDGLADT